MRKHLESEGGSDLIRDMVSVFVHQMMAAEVDALNNAAYGEITPEQTNSRNGYRHRQLDTRVGMIDVAIPKLRHDTYFPGWLLEPRRRGRAGTGCGGAECYARGVSTRRVEGLVQTLGIESLSKSQVSRMAAELGTMVTKFRVELVAPSCTDCHTEHDKLATRGAPLRIDVDSGEDMSVFRS